MADTPEYQKGTGPDALPQGEATATNEAIAAIPDNPAPEVPIAPPAEAPVESPASVEPPTNLSPGGQSAPGAGATLQMPPFRPANDIEQYLTDYNGPPMFDQTLPNLQPLPPGSQDWVEQIQLAAQSPTASAALKQAATNLAVRLRANG